MLKRLSIRYKIGFIALIGFLGFAIYQTATYRLSVDVRDQLQTILTEDFSVLKFANEVQVQFSELDKGYQSSLTEADPELLRDTDAKAMQIRMNFELLKNKYGIDDPLFTELFRAFDSYAVLTSAHTAAVLANTLTYERTLDGYAQVNLLRERYNDIHQTFLDERYKSFETQLIAIEQAEEALVNFGLLLGLFLSAVLVLLSFAISRRITRAFSNAVNVAEQIASGNLDHPIHNDSEDETGLLLQSLHAMRDVLKSQNEENYNRAKTQNFLGGLNEIMRGDKSLGDLSSAVLAYLAKQLYAQHGALYIFEGSHLQLTAEYARPANGESPKRFALGETMLGQTAVDREARIITDIPENYMTIGSGTGKAAPRSIMLVPVVFEDKLKAVIEIAAFQRFAEDDLELVERCNDAIAIAINSAQVRFAVADMLERTQEQTQELQRQRQELALFNQRLEEKTEDLDRQRNQVLQKNQELEESRRELIEKSEALELSGRYKSQFLSTISHELRTPLNSILILSEALMENRKDNLLERDVQHARVIHTAGGELLALINDILDLSKVEEGKMELVIDKIEVASLASSLVQQFEYQARERGLQYQVNIADDAPAVFYSDKQRLQQIIRNFVSNALKFTEHGGVYIDIGRPEKIYSSTLDADNSILITVRDTGVGIEPSKQNLVFEAFKQADGTTSRKFGGTGLGLTISRELAKLLGGKITLYSAGSGKGAEFSLLLPLGDASMVKQEGTQFMSKPLALSDSAHQLSGKEKVLIIEDNPVFQEVLRSVFANGKIDVSIAAEGYDALEMLTETPYDCLIADLNLPDIDGVELLGKIRQLPTYSDTPIIVFTAEDVNSERKQQVMQFANYIANKTPQSVIEVCKMVQQILQQQQQLIYKPGMLAGTTLLLVDDDPRNLYSMCSILDNEGIYVITAKSGAEALSILEEESSIQLVLLDIMMPEMDGYEVLQRLREQEKYKNLPVVAITAKAMAGDRERCLQEGANAYLAKPVKPKVLLDTIVSYIKA